MSVASEITRIQNAKASLKTSINAKTDQQHQITTETIDDYADFVDSITTGGSLLPDGYTQVSWLKATGTQYINTGYRINENSVIKILAWKERGGGLMGVRTASSPSSTNAYFISSRAVKQSGWFWGDFGQPVS